MRAINWKTKDSVGEKLFPRRHSQAGVPLSLEPKRTLRAGSPNEFFWGIGIAKRPEIASQDRIVHCEMVASKR